MIAPQGVLSELTIGIIGAQAHINLTLKPCSSSASAKSFARAWFSQLSERAMCGTSDPTGEHSKTTGERPKGPIPPQIS
jgi:hypothetical protein